MPRRPHTAPQGGILTPPPDHLLAVGLTISATEPAAVRESLENLRNIVHEELRSDLADEDAATPKDSPPPETGELGFTDHYDRYGLTITVGFGSTCYDKLGTPTEDRPQDLRPIPWQLLGDAPSIPTNGDLLLQLCADSVYILEHVLRHIEHELAEQITIEWTLTGHQRHTSRRGHVNRDEGRALIGFLDGTSNLDPRNNLDDNKLVFVDPSEVKNYPPKDPVIDPGQPNPYGGGEQLPTFPELQPPPTFEPPWCEGGSYIVVRGSTLDISAWDKALLGDQEHHVGRWKFSGNALDQADDDAVTSAAPNFAADPDGNTTPLTAHIRKANPRGPGDDDRRIFRRGYPLITSAPAGLQRGLAFICFGRTITTQFEFIDRAWMTNPNFPRPNVGVDRLRQFEQVLSGGYFFAPPLQHSREPWSWTVPG